ncbi:hypothetical protein N9S06_02860 [Gammaproteobacteria bacterium]|nr:hypothetical protein [Gammaproteobacteria bacterium]
MKKILSKITPIIIFTFIITSCGGGGGGGGGESEPYTPPATPAATASISLSGEKGYVGEDIIITWSSTNATSCTASNAWTGTKDTSGSESFSFDTAGLFTFEISCTGSGGSGSSSASINVFKYDKQTDDVANKNWNAEATGVIHNINLSSEPFPINIFWINDIILTTSAFEPPDGTFELNYSGISPDGSSFDFNPIFDNWNESNDLLYDPDDIVNPTYKRIIANDGDFTINGVFTLPDYYSNRGIDYISYGLTEIFADSEFYILPTIVGEFTQSDDVPTSGTSVKEFESLGYFVCTYNVNNFCSAGDLMVTDGKGTLNFDFSNNTFGGSLTYNAFATYNSLKNNTVNDNLINSRSSVKVPIKEGLISGSQFTARIENIDVQEIEVGVAGNTNGSGKDVFVIDGVEKKSLNLNRGTMYSFRYPSSSHPLRFSTTSDGTHGGGSEYTNWVTVYDESITIEINDATPETLYYYCDVHSGMGSDITVNPNPNGDFRFGGIIQGHFFGPNAEEIGMNISFINEKRNFGIVSDDEREGYSYNAGGIGQSE